MKVVDMSKKGDEIRLDIKIGFLTIDDSLRLKFENYDLNQAGGKLNAANLESLSRSKKNNNKSFDVGKMSGALSTTSG